MKLLVHEIIGTFIHGITQQRIWRIARIFCDPQSIRIVSKGEVPSTREDRDLGERIRERDGLREQVVCEWSASGQRVVSGWSVSDR